MPDYIIAYRGWKEAASQEAGAKGREAFMAWIAELGDAVINPGTPLGPSRTVSSDGISVTPDAYRMTGYSVVQADSLEAALRMAKGCPFLEMGTVEVAEMMSMS